MNKEVALLQDCSEVHLLEEGGGVRREGGGASVLQAGVSASCKRLNLRLASQPFITDLAE